MAIMGKQIHMQIKTLLLYEQGTNYSDFFNESLKKYMIFREGVLPQATGVLPRHRGKTPFCKVLGKTLF